MMAFPGILAAYQAFYFLIFVKYDSPQFYLRKDDLPSYKLVLSQIYDEKSIIQELERYENQDNTTITRKNTSTARTTYREVLCSSRFRKMIRIGIILSCAQQLSGINAMVFYSSTIYQNLGNGIFMARLITCFQGVS